MRSWPPSPRGRGFAMLALAGLAVAALPACTASVTGGTRRSGYAVVALQEAPDALDPTMSATYVGRIVFANMCEKLYDANAHLRLVPQLAAAMPKIGDGGKTYTIPLRRGIRFNDGTPFDARAVKASLLRDIHNKTSQRSSELTSVSGVRVVNSHTVRLRLRQPFAPLTAVLADRSGMVMSPKALRTWGAHFARHPVCVGPFRFSSRPNPDEINLVKSPYYYDRDKVHLAGVTFRTVVQANVRAQDLRAGDVDVVDRADPQDLQTLKSDPDTRVDPVTSLGYQGITINTGNAHGYAKPPAAPHTPLARRPVLRRAFALSLDRKVINKVVFDGANVPDCSPIPPDSPWAVHVPCPPRNLEKARELVKRSGVHTPIPVSLVVQNSDIYEQLGTVIQAMARDAGFKVSVRPTEFTTALTNAQNGKFDAFQVGWSGRLDPDQDISQMYLPHSSLNYTGAHDPKINSLIARARREQRPASRKRLYTELVKLLNSNNDLIQLYHDRYILGLRKNIHGVAFYGDGLIRLKTARLENP